MVSVWYLYGICVVDWNMQCGYHTVWYLISGICIVIAKLIVMVSKRISLASVLHRHLTSFQRPHCQTDNEKKRKAFVIRHTSESSTKCILNMENHNF